MNKRIQSIITILASFGMLELLSFLKINVLLGAKTAVFSGFSIGGPLLGVYSGMGFGAALFMLRRMIHCLYLGTSLFSPFSLYLPTLAAAYYFKSSSWVIRCVVPLVCIMLFIMHPVGGQVWFYSLYWLVPIVFYVMPLFSAFTEALGATFVQHAVGSVLWLYLVPTTAGVWIALMPIVVIERFLCATGMIAVMQVVSFVRGITFEKINFVKQIYTKI